jgi:hypothetical protein
MYPQLQKKSFGLIVRAYEGIWYHCEDVTVRGGEGEIGYIEIGRIMRIN